jgi:hypothetical protein
MHSSYKDLYQVKVRALKHLNQGFVPLAWDQPNEKELQGFKSMFDHAQT